MAKSRRLELGDNIYGHYRSTFNHCDVFGQQSNRIRWKTQNKGYYAVQGHSRSSRSVPLESRLQLPIVININWQPISYRCVVIVAYYSNFGHCVFEPPFGGLWTTYDIHLGLVGKHVVDFLLVIIKLFFARCYGRGATGENRSKIGDFAPTLSVWLKILGRRGRPQPIIFAWVVRPMNALHLCRWQFSHKETL